MSGVRLNNSSRAKKLREGLNQEAHPKKGQHQAGLASPSQPAMDLLRLLGSLR